MIRQGVKNTSVICVLVGTETWQRPWVRYEIARALINRKGLLAVHINGLPHHQTLKPDQRGFNPCGIMGIARAQNNNHCLCERVYVDGAWTWRWYARQTDPVPLPKYMKPPTLGQPVPLSEVTSEYDWSQNGAKNIGSWIDMAAQEAGR
jgi:hypothetical protein